MGGCHGEGGGGSEDVCQGKQQRLRWIIEDSSTSTLKSPFPPRWSSYLRTVKENAPIPSSVVLDPLNLESF